MTRECCDICGADVTGCDFKDLFGGREYRVVERRTCDDQNDVMSLTLCQACAQCLTYYMRNRQELAGRVTTMSLKNRIRYLFLRPLKAEKGGQHHED